MTDIDSIVQALEWQHRDGLGTTKGFPVGRCARCEVPWPCAAAQAAVALKEMQERAGHYGRLDAAINRAAELQVRLAEAVRLLTEWMNPDSEMPGEKLEDATATFLQGDRERQVAEARNDPAFMAGVERGLQAHREGRTVPWGEACAMSEDRVEYQAGSDRLAEIQEAVDYHGQLQAPDVRYLLAHIDALTAENEDFRRIGQEMMQERDAEHRKWVAANDQRANLHAALEAVEWVTCPHDSYCPWCQNDRQHRHHEDCQRQAALATDTERGLPAEPPAADA